MIIYTIVDNEGNVILNASSQEKAKEQLFEYMGLGIDSYVIYKEFHPYNPEIPDDYQGYYLFDIEWKKPLGPKYDEKYYLYCKILDESQAF
jgi:hypothetical protein